ncbi:uncharacterized protein PGTG_12015 [Puccinia graminis f. sp. tritici CRL 75-36-700-3]|uniref:Uncharacterized protein n=1 Tax=Puccinia graminis f. sp. tritici (strain CRL 75-36-700-3 / race SCCL) TaxID=418459 RepID=E3KP34_PUCGT|nr:uncharacterized protein PGTG_12015 [Puccinia graminis f. sp. tritici CRL 75-36-700-3]EFP86059.2 hypothetical protein PGTG_12015 [Puccinia graminis f. sp. tritici CRL 75-36-700-3]
MPVQNDPNFVRPSNNYCKALPSSSATQTTARQTCKQPQQPSSALASTSTCVACKTKNAKVNEKGIRFPIGQQNARDIQGHWLHSGFR